MACIGKNYKTFVFFIFIVEYLYWWMTYHIENGLLFQTHLQLFVVSFIEVHRKNAIYIYNIIRKHKIVKRICLNSLAIHLANENTISI